MKTLSKIALSLALGLGVATTSFAETTTAIQAATQAQTVKTADGLNLYLQKDIPEQKPKAVVVISHGLASHSGVFNDFAKTMNNNAIAVYRFDHRGHGKSDGRDKIHIKSYFEMVEDLRLVVKKAPSRKIPTRRFLC